MVPLAVLSQDPSVKLQVDKYLDYILSHQDPSGWLGPGSDPWPRFPLILALQQMAEGDPDRASKYIDPMLSFLKNLYSKLVQQPLRSWAQYRWQDLGLALEWLSSNTQGNDKFLADFFDLIAKQGFDWTGFYSGSQFPKGPCLSSCQSLATHGVNNGQALKEPAVRFFRDQSKMHQQEFNQRLQKLDQ
jgi:hypothetical protein